jgi:ligand-binding sensor domain-containing protein/signal transduction histidine kinase
MLLCVLALIATAAQPAAQAPRPEAGAQYIARAWTTETGLPQNSVTAIVQTRDGYLWVGTFGGLVRFDGHAFTVFDPGNSPGLASARIVSLYEDRQQVLWIGTEAGLTRLERGRFTSYDAADGLTAGAVWATLRDRRGRLWVGTESGLSRFDGRAFTTMSVAGAHSPTLGLAESPDGHDVWAATWDGVARFRDGETAAEFLRAPGVSTVTRCLLFDRAGRLWVGSDSGLSAWDGTRLTGVPADTPGGVSTLSQDRDGNLWVGTQEGGLRRWREGTVSREIPLRLSNPKVRAVLADAEDNVWVGTEVDGLHRLKRRQVFSYVNPDAKFQSIGPIVGDGGNGLWIGGTCGSLIHFDGVTFRTYHHPKLECIWALHRDAAGLLWIGATTTGGVTRFDGTSFTRFAGGAGLHDDVVLGIAGDHDGALWVGTSRGVSRWDGRRVTHYGRAEGLTHDVKVIVRDRRGGLWVGGLGGLSRFEQGRFTRYTAAQGLSHDHVRAIYEDADGVLWIGTYGGGLNRLKDGRFTTIGIKEGLPDAAVSRIIEDARGNLWMSGNKGVYRVARSQLNDFADGRIAYVTAVSYGTADGMVIDETNGGQPAGWQTPDGKLWFPTIKGLVGIDPVAEAASPPPVVVERAVVGGRAIDPRDLAPLGPGAVDAEFHYTAIDLGAAEKTRFRYRLEGNDGHWTDAGPRRVAYYTGLRPGSYHFEVVATDRDGQWSTTPARVAVIVRPFWWQRREAIAAALVLLVVVTGLTVRSVSLRRARARLAELEREQTLERERTRIARDLHDDLGSRLSHISILAGAGGVTERDARISREALAAVQTMDELVWAVNARNDTVESFANYVAHFAEDQAGAAGLRCRLLLPPDPPARALGADVRRHLYFAVKEAINNAVKHAQASEIRVELRVEPQTLVVEVADNGCGLPANIDPTGNGLRNFRERMEAAGGAVEVVSSPGAGTRLVFTTPLGGA